VIQDILKLKQLHFQARSKNDFTGVKEFERLARELSEKLQKTLGHGVSLTVKDSLGSGDRSHTPFLGFYEKPYSENAKKGVYILVIFSADGKHCYLGVSHSGLSGIKRAERASYTKQYLDELRRIGKLDKSPEKMLLRANIAGNSPTGKLSEVSFILGFEISPDTSDDEFVHNYKWLRSCLINLSPRVQAANRKKVGINSPSGMLLTEGSDNVTFRATKNPDVHVEDVSSAVVLTKSNTGIEMLLGDLTATSARDGDYQLAITSKTYLSGKQLDLAERLLTDWGDSLCFHEIDEQQWKLLVGDEMPLQPKKRSPIVEALLTYRNVILEGVAGTGKTYALREIEDSGVFNQTTLVVMHQNYSYEEFVEGLKPVGSSFEVTDGVFTSACIEASKHPQEKYLLVLDEVNRSNTAKVLGELLHLIEPSKRLEPEAAHEILNSKNNGVFGDKGVLLGLLRPSSEGMYRLRLSMPSNLYLLGTMNTTDRSVGSLDLALRRRFVFKRIEPHSLELLAGALEDKTLLAALPVWQKLNDFLKEHVGRDAQIGHSYFFEAEQAKLRASDVKEVHIYRDLILPQLCEILVTFGAVSLVETEAFLALDFDGWTVKLEGRGLDRLPYVATR
jgi:hypothetical protein